MSFVFWHLIEGLYFKDYVHGGCRNLCNLFVFSHQVITLEGWVDIMYYVMDAHSFYNFIYFIFLIIVSAQ